MSASRSCNPDRPFKRFTTRKVREEHRIPLANCPMVEPAETIVRRTSDPGRITNIPVGDTRGTPALPGRNEIGPTTH